MVRSSAQLRERRPPVGMVPVVMNRASGWLIGSIEAPSPQEVAALLDE